MDFLSDSKHTEIAQINVITLQFELMVLIYHTNAIVIDPALIRRNTVCTVLYSRTSLVGTPGDRQNAFALSGIRIN